MSNTNCYTLPITSRPRDLILPRRRSLGYIVGKTPRITATDCVLPKGVRTMPPRRRFQHKIEVLFYDEVKKGEL
jgi:hypothetical protein